MTTTRPVPFVLAGFLAAYVFIAGTFNATAIAQEKQTTVREYRTETNIPYRDDSTQNDYMRERCRLDIYVPVTDKPFATVVWFHGGGLTGGERSIPNALKQKGIGVIAVGYRLGPKAKSPDYIDDAAAAVAWTFQNIQKYGGDSKQIYVSGHSAGGYLTSMIGLDKRWLNKYGVDANEIAGLIPYSGQAITHFTIREERGISRTQPIIDEFAPLYHVRKDAPPMLLISGDRNMELIGRYEETAYFWRMMKEVGHTQTELFELQGFNHGDMAEPAHPLLLRFIQSRTQK